MKKNRCIFLFVIILLLVLTANIVNVGQQGKNDLKFSTTADCQNFFVLNQKVYVQSGVVPSWLAHFCIGKYLGKTQYLSEKDCDYVPEKPEKYANLQGNIEGLNVYAFFGKTAKNTVICHNDELDMYYIYKVKL